MQTPMANQVMNDVRIDFDMHLVATIVSALIAPKPETVKAA